MMQEILNFLFGQPEQGEVILAFFPGFIPLLISAIGATAGGALGGREGARTSEFDEESFREFFQKFMTRDSPTFDPESGAFKSNLLQQLQQAMANPFQGPDLEEFKLAQLGRNQALKERTQRNIDLGLAQRGLGRSPGPVGSGFAFAEGQAGEGLLGIHEHLANLRQRDAEMRNASRQSLFQTSAGLLPQLAGNLRTGTVEGTETGRRSGTNIAAGPGALAGGLQGFAEGGGFSPGGLIGRIGRGLSGRNRDRSFPEGEVFS